jgi:hypothetical protein
MYDSKKLGGFPADDGYGSAPGIPRSRCLSVLPMPMFNSHSGLTHFRVAWQIDGVNRLPNRTVFL